MLFHEAHAADERVKHLRAMMAVERESYEPTPYADISGGPYYDLVFPYYPKNPILLDLAFWRRSRGSIFFDKGSYQEDDVREMRDLYDGAVAYTDDNLARILKTLAELELETSTIVAVTADHGEAFGEHGLSFTHDFTLYDEVLRVPLVIRYPGVIECGSCNAVPLGEYAQRRIAAWFRNRSRRYKASPEHSARETTPAVTL